MSNATSEATWVLILLQELHINNLRLVTLHYDNNPSIINIVKNPIYYDRIILK